MKSHRRIVTIRRFHLRAGGFSPRIAVAILALLVIGGLAIGSGMMFISRDSSLTSSGKVAGQADQAAEHPPRNEGFVGSEACATCHQGIFDAFQSHPMAHSTAPVLGHVDDISSGAASAVKGDGIIFDVELDDGRMLHRERFVDASGETIVQEAVEMQFVVGSGRRAKAYLAQRGDLLFMSPLNWYSESHRWDMAPGYSVNDPRRFERRVTDACLVCHAGRVAPAGPLPNRFQPEVFHEAAIGCENCHGPGQQHIDYHSNSSVASADPIVNPVELDASRREAVCNQCHLQATARVLRPGRTEFDFRPGHRMEDVWAVLDAGAGVDAAGRTQSVNHVQQMRDSVCFKQSDGRLGCISCHDPHRVPAPAERVGFYRQRCLSCHETASCSASPSERERRDDSCIACHMPGRDTHNMSHVTQTDHRVLKVAQTSESQASNASPTSLAFFNDEQELLPEWEQQRALGLGAWMYLQKIDQRPSIGVARMLIPVLDKQPRDGMTLLALGSIASLNGKRELALDYFRTAVEVPEAKEEALINLLDLEYQAGHWAEALSAADRLLEINPWRAKTHALRADALSHLGRPDDGIAAAERALELNPALTPVREWLIDAYRSAGRDAERESQEELLRRFRESQNAGTAATERDSPAGARSSQP